MMRRASLECGGAERKCIPAAPENPIYPSPQPCRRRHGNQWQETKAPDVGRREMEHLPGVRKAQCQNRRSTQKAWPLLLGLATDSQRGQGGRPRALEQKQAGQEENHVCSS